MKRLLIILMTFPLMVLSQQTFVPDDNFELALIGMGYDNFLDDYVLTSNISSMTYLNVGGHNIQDMTGVEDMLGLITLYCDQNQITDLDVSNLIYLENLGCGCSCSGGNLLSSLDISQNTRLKWLQCEQNSISSLDLSNNLLLESLEIGWNPITALNVSANISLKFLDAYNFPLATLTSIDVTNNSNLEVLNIGSNQITSLDLSNNSKLRYLSVSDNILPTLDVSNMPFLETLLCGHSWSTNYGGQLTSLNVTNNPLLTSLHCGGNQISGSLDLSNNTLITWLTCEKNMITNLDLSSLSSLLHLDCSDNNLVELNIANGNNINFVSNYPADPSLSPAISALNNPDLTCINVDDQNFSNTIWTSALGFYIDAQHYYSVSCFGSTAINELATPKKLLSVTDLLGRKSQVIANEPLFYIYDNGTVERRVVIK